MRRWWPLGGLGGLALLTPVTLRIILLFEKDLPWNGQDARGLLSDLAVGGFAAAVVVALASRTGVGAWLCGVVWLLLNVINYEHVRVFDAPVQPTYATYLTDATFVSGSAVQVTHPVLFGGALLLLCVSAAFWRRVPARVPARQVWITTGFATGLLLATSLFSLHPHHLPWRQMHVLPLTVRGAFAAEAPLPAVTAEGTERVAQVYRADLAGTPRFPFERPQGAKRPNVLIVAVEGLSGGYLPSVRRHQGVDSGFSMPRLDETAQRGLLFENFIGPQRQTNRGLYSILCGDLPKLLSVEARMSEYVRVTPEARRRCLPRALSEAGYRTVYLQAAPLAFMMKDQFMKAAGFDEIRGTTAFPKSYARNRWGVDDRAFFEGAAERIQALDAEAAATGKPWFATLLTVGTHHPFLVPDGYGKGSGHARAVSYADEALDGLLRTLQAKGVLDDTLVLLTADESAGVTRGDDHTRSLSQNWLPLVVLGPGVVPGRVTDVYAQPDLAVSILDYLGLAGGEGQWMGRSLFRHYDAPRPLYFANTYFNRVYALEPGGVLSACSERFDECRSHAVDPERPFGPARRPVAWQPERLAGLRAVVARSVEPADAKQGERAGPQTLTLVHRDRVELSGTDSQIIFGGQYLTAQPGSRFEVELEFEIERADGIVELHQDLFAGGRVYHRPGVPLLAQGDRVRLRYDYVFKGETPSVEARFAGRPIMGAGATVRIHKAQLTVTPNAGDGTWERLSQKLFDVKREPRDEGLRFTLDDSTPFRRPRCVTDEPKNRTLVGRDCKATYALFGPYAWAKAGATVKVRFEIELTRGEANLRADLVSDLSRSRHVVGDQVNLRAGQRTTLELEHRAARALEAIESRLEVRPVGGGTADFVIRAASLTIEPPTRVGQTVEPSPSPAGTPPPAGASAPTAVTGAP